MNVSSRLRARALGCFLVTAVTIVFSAGSGTGCAVRNAEPPYLQITRLSASELPCDDVIHVDEIVDIFSGDDPEFCAYGCGRRQRYVCSEVTGDCRDAWPNVCP